MTYTQLKEHVYLDSKILVDELVEALPARERVAWKILEILKYRKGFSSWWRAPDFSDESRDEIFAAMVELVTSED